MKNKKAFTLIELLAVIIILAIVALIATPIVLNVIEDAKKSAGQSEANMIMNGIINYCETEKMGIKNTDYCVDGIMKKEYIENIVNLGKVTDINAVILGGKLEELTVNSNGNEYGLNKDKMELDYKLYRDKSGANKPELFDNMIPIKYVDNKWIYADETQEWYDYNKKEWANAVVLSESGKSKTVGQEITEDDIDLWYVWIPRYKYQLFSSTPTDLNNPPEINVIFENETETTGTIVCEDDIKTVAGSSSEKCYKVENGVANKIEEYTSDKIDYYSQYYTHPAFTVNKGTKLIKEIKGIWVGKFEVSDPTNLDSKNVNQAISKITIKPNVSSLRKQNIRNFKIAIEKMKIDYNINGYTHVIRNMEWGAVAYLSQSKYGKGTTDIIINNNTNYITGGGNNNLYRKNVNQSTTQNIYGIYDMSGGTWEFVMGSIINLDGSFNDIDFLLFDFPIEYYDKYSFNNDLKISLGGKLGDATKETKNWYEDDSNFPKDGRTWFKRGGYHAIDYNAGLFSFYSNNDNVYVITSTRGVLSSH